MEIREAKKMLQAKLECMPLPLVLRNIEQNIELLSQRGIKIRDWDNKDRVLTQVRIIGGKVYFLAATEPEAKKD